MKSNEEYLDELLKSMGGDSNEDTALTRLQSDSMAEEIENLGGDLLATAPSQEANMGKMDQSLIDALLAAAAGTEDEVEAEKEPTIINQSEIDAFLAAEAEADGKMPEQEDADISLDSMEQEVEADISLDFMEQQGTLDISLDSIEPEIKDEFDIYETSGGEGEMDSSSMLAQLMAEMQEETLKDGDDSFEEDSLLTEDSIEALLNAAQSGSDDMLDEQPISFDIQDDSEMAEIEALLSMSENEEVIDENDALLRMLQEAEGDVSVSGLENTEEDAELDMSQLETILTPETSENAEKTDVASEGKKKKKEKKPFNMKGFFGKIFSALMEEVPEEEESKSLNLSDENKEVLNQLEKETEKKIKVKEKKAKKEKAKKEKPVKEKKPPKEKKPKKEKAPYIPEKKVPKKKVVVTVVFAASVLALILLIEYLVPPMLTVSRARTAYDKGEYYEAYKEYYGQKLSEEDEIRFQGATTIMRIQSNLDGYHNYLKMNKEVKALHSLLEAVHVKFDVFLKAEEFNVLTQVSAIYNEILEILGSKYHLSEEDAMSIIEEDSDVIYTHKLESIVENGEYTGSFSDVNQNDLLPQEEELFYNSGE